MARMHSRRKGKSKSRKPLKYGQSSWTLFYDQERIKKEIIKMKKSGISQSLIGTILRDQYAIPDVREIFGKKLSEILKEEKLIDDVPEDLQNLMKKAVKLRKHLEIHKKDIHNRRALQLIESKIKRLEKYYKREGKLPETWSYEPEKMKYLV
ncbi:MAG: 30S ribosomal protein S15 [Candidatus Altarchaeaceae archaeon]